MKTAKWIRDRRAAAGLTQAELGRKVGASQPMISLWERGASPPPPDILKKLRTVLDGKPAPQPSEPPRKKERDPLSREAGEGRGGGAPSRRAKSAKGNGSEESLEAKLWASADRLRGHMDPGDYKYVVLGLIFLKYISDAFEDLHDRLKADPEANPEERDHYLAENVFWVPREARWPGLKARAKSPEIGKAVDKCHGGHRAGEPSPPWRAPEGLRPSILGQGPPRRAGGPRLHHRPRPVGWPSAGQRADWPG